MSNSVNPSGMYFLANDRVLNWSIAFLESLRAHEPDLRVVMIPFDRQIEKIGALRDRYRFEVLQDESLTALDAIGERFFPSQNVPAHTFRKFAVFWGPLEQFLFCDVDIVFLEGRRQFQDAYARAQLDLLHADEEMSQVYERAELRRRMIETYGARGFNTGFWAARRGLFSLPRIQQLADEAMPVSPAFNQGTYEQPFLNYCCDVSRVRYGHFADLIPDLTRKFLAVQPGIRRDGDGAYRVHDAVSPNHGKRITFLHWAGTPANAAMPYRSLFLKYRLRSESPAWRIWIRMWGLPGELLGRAARWGRETTLISRAYKRMLPRTLQERVTQLLRGKHV